MIQASQSPNLYLDIAPDAQRAERGNEVVFLITIENRGREAQAQTLELGGLPEAWIELDFDARRRVFPGERRTANLLVKVPREASAASLPFSITARAGDDQSTVASSLEVVVPGEASVQPVVVPPPKQAVFPPGITLAPQSVEWRGEAQGTETITLTVRNVSAEDASYVLALDGLPSGWYTLPDRISVQARQLTQVPIAVSPPAQARQGDYAVRVTANLVGDESVRASATSTFTVAALERRQGTQRTISPLVMEEPAEQERSGPPALPPDIRLAPRSTFRFGPGEVNAQATITVTNPSALIERYRIALRGIDEEWYQLDMPEVSLQPGASTTVPLRLMPRTGAKFPAGDYSFRIRVTPLNYPDSAAETTGTISIAGSVSFDARLTPAQATGRKEKFKLTLLNTGGVPLSPWVEASDPQGACKFVFEAPNSVEVGEETVVPVWVGATRQGFVGRPQTYDFRLRVSPAGGGSASARFFDARFVHQPFLGPRTLMWCVVIVFLASIVGVVLSLGFSSVDRAAQALKCGYDDDYQRVEGGPVLIREDCGGAPRVLQEQVTTNTVITPASTGSKSTDTVEPGVTTAPSQGVTPENACVADPGIGLTIGDEVTLRVDAVVRDAPGGTDTGDRGNNLAGSVLAGPECAGGLVWWEVETANSTGWTAEQDDKGVRLILPP